MIHVNASAKHHRRQLDLVGVGLGSGHDAHVLDSGGETKGDPSSFLFTVQASEVESHGNDQNELHAPTTNVDVEAGQVFGLFFCQIDLWADDVAHCQGPKHGRSRQNPFRRPRCIEVAPGDEKGLNTGEELSDVEDSEEGPWLNIASACVACKDGLEFATDQCLSC